MFGGNRSEARYFAVETACPQRVPDVERAVGEQLPDRLLQDERDRALIYPDSFEGGDVDEPDRYRFVYSVVEFLDAVIDIGGQERMRPVEPELPFDFEQGRAHRDLDRPSCVFADDRKGV